jgi:GNAT superfamily N-acetyltransferase
MRYEPLSADNVQDAVTLGSAMHAASAYADIEFSARRIEALAQQVTRYPSSYYTVICYDGDRPVGLMAGSISQHYFSDVVLASDWALYVLPGQRNAGLIAAALVRRFERWALENGAQRIVLGITAQIDNAAVSRLYERLGYRYMGSIHEKRC